MRIKKPPKKNAITNRGDLATESSQMRERRKMQGEGGSANENSALDLEKAVEKLRRSPAQRST